MRRGPGPGRPADLESVRVEVGVVVPVHDEEEHLAASLLALEAAARAVRPAGVRVTTVVVLDACCDGSGAIARAWESAASGAEDRAVVGLDARNVGRARALGVASVRARHRAGLSWLATTDADSQVPEDWLAHQLDLWRAGVAVWSGGVDVTDWSERDGALAGRWRRLYEVEADPVHGASLGLTPAAYDACGGFPDRTTGEDRALVRAATACGAVVHHCRCVPVLTSSRRHARAPLGFAHALTRLEHG